MGPGKILHYQSSNLNCVQLYLKIVHHQSTILNPQSFSFLNQKILNILSFYLNHLSLILHPQFNVFHPLSSILSCVCVCVLICFVLLGRCGAEIGSLLGYFLTCCVLNKSLNFCIANPELYLFAVSVIR